MKRFLLWRSAFFLTIAGGFALLCAPSLKAQNGLSFDGLIKDPSVLVGKPCMLRFMNGTMITEVEAGPFIQDRSTGAVRIVQYTEGTRRVKKKVHEVYRIWIEGKPYGFRFNGPANGYFLIDKAQARTQIESRLADKSKSVRSLSDEQETKDAVQAQRKFLDDFRKGALAQKLEIHESQFSILLTDYPPITAKQFGKYIDDLCIRLNSLISIPVTANVWEGKVVVAIFSDQIMFGDFQTTMLKNPNFGTSSVIYHTKTDKFVVSCHGKKIPSIARNLCWAVAGGYVGRYGSNAAIPEWVRVGTREWVSSTIFDDRSRQSKRTQQVARELQRSKSLLGILSAKEFDIARRPTTLTLVAFLASKSQAAYGQFFNDLKSGHDWKDALMSNYAMTDRQLAAAFGASLGVRGLVP